MDKKKKYIKIFLIAILDSIAFCISAYCGNLIVRPFCHDWYKTLLASGALALFLFVYIYILLVKKADYKYSPVDVFAVPLMVIFLTVVGMTFYTVIRSELDEAAEKRVNEATSEQSAMTESSNYDVFLPDYVANDIKFTINDLVLISNYIAHSEYADHIHSLKFDSYSVSDDVVTIIVTNQDNFKYMIDVDKDRNISMSDYKGSSGDDNLPGTPIYKFSEEDKAKFNDYVHQLPNSVSTFTVNSVEEKSCCYYVFYLDENNAQCYLRYDKSKVKVTEYGTVDKGEKIKTADV